MKVWVVEKIDEWDGQVDTQTALYDSKEKAIKQMEQWKEDDFKFIDDVREIIKDGNLDSHIDEEELYFYCYDGLNFDAKTISIHEMEVL